MSEKKLYIQYWRKCRKEERMFSDTKTESIADFREATPQDLKDLGWIKVTDVIKAMVSAGISQAIIDCLFNGDKK